MPEQQGQLQTQMEIHSEAWTGPERKSTNHSAINARKKVRNCKHIHLFCF